MKSIGVLAIATAVNELRHFPARDTTADVASDAQRRARKTVETCVLPRSERPQRPTFPEPGGTAGTHIELQLGLQRPIESRSRCPASCAWRRS